MHRRHELMRLTESQNAHALQRRLSLRVFKSLTNSAVVSAEQALAAERHASVVQFGDLNAKLDSARAATQAAASRCADAVAAMAGERLQYVNEANELTRTFIFSVQQHVKIKKHRL